MNNSSKAASLAAKIKDRFGLDAVLVSGSTGQFDVIADGEAVVTRGGNWLTRRLGAGYPDFDGVVDVLEKRRARGGA